MIQDPWKTADQALDNDRLPPVPSRLRIVCIGDELLSGLRRDTNSAQLLERLSKLGLQIDEVRIVADQEAPIRDLAREEDWFTISTGGLGPTRDDRSREILARAFGCPLIHDDEHRRRFQQRLREMGRDPGIAAMNQSLHPRPGLNFPNPVGSADALLFQRSNSLWLALPGVPTEMRALLDSGLLDWLGRYFRVAKAAEVLYARVWQLPEQEVARRVELNDLLNETTLGYYPSPDGVLVKCQPQPGQDLELCREALCHSLKDHLLHNGPESMIELISAELKRAGQNISFAESCTGGMLAAAMTDQPGSSAVFAGAIVSYANEQKKVLLGVDPNCLSTYGAVSGECVAQMAKGCRQKLGTDWALSISGIAGPSGGTVEKPVGTIWMGLVGPGIESSLQMRTSGNREQIRLRARGRAFAWLYRCMSTT